MKKDAGMGLIGQFITIIVAIVLVAVVVVMVSEEKKATTSNETYINQTIEENTNLTNETTK